MSHIVKVLQVPLSLGFIPQVLQVGTILQLTDEQFAQISPAAFTDANPMLQDITPITNVGPKLNFTFNQPNPSSTWTIVHNLGYYPAGLVCEDGLGNIIGGFNRVDPDVNTTIISFGNSSFSGTAFLS